MDEPEVVESTAPAPRSWTRWAAPIGLLGAGALVGGILASTLTAGAAPSPSPSPGHNAPGVPGGPDFRGPGVRGPGMHMLDHTGTVTAVGASSVTIKESSGTTTYAVDANSDIDKNGEAKLSDLKAGDGVRFSVVTVSGKKTIGILHSGDEALNRPHGGHGPHPGEGGPGMPGSGTGTEGSSTGTSFSA